MWLHIPLRDPASCRYALAAAFRLLMGELS